jgi:diguanylate cyclase (GGDEF)-like protein
VNRISRLDLSIFPDSPYAAELRRGPASLRFTPELETEYASFRLLQSRTLIRVACMLAAVLAVLRGLEQASQGTWNWLFAADAGLIVAGSIALTFVAWSRSFQRLYLRFARIVVPARNAIVAAHIGVIAAHGQLEMLMVLPIMLIGPFFFLGLRFRTALLCCALTVVSYVAAASFFELSEPVALRSYIFLIANAAACIVAARYLESGSRLSFLEGKLLVELAQCDALTGTKNRRVFDAQLNHLWRQATEDRRPLAIILIDIDHFKAYNDCYGHQAGDQALRKVAASAQRFVRRPLDVLARYGGEEFAVILYDIDREQAKEIADRIRLAVGGLAIEHRGSRTSPVVTISAGVAAVEPTVDRTPSGALQLADQALYEAKVRGRNRVELMGCEQHSLLETGVFSIAAVRAANG